MGLNIHCYLFFVLIHHTVSWPRPYEVELAFGESQHSLSFEASKGASLTFRIPERAEEANAETISRNHPQLNFHPNVKGRPQPNVVIHMPGDVDNNDSHETISSPSSVVTEDLSDGSGMAAAEGSGNEVIFFPGLNSTGGASPVNPAENTDETCNIEIASVYHNGKCEYLLTQGPCDDGDWLVLNEIAESVCVPRLCPKGELFFRGNCVAITDYSSCGPSEILYIDYTGDVYCDCQPDYIYDEGTKRCHAEHDRGSCQFGYQLEFDSEGRVKCVSNACMREDLVINPETQVCHVKLYSGACSSEKLLGIKFQDDRTAICYSVINRNIFEVPALTSCPPGSKRSYLGTCQKVIRVGPRSPFSFSVPSQYSSRYSVCPHNYTKYPDGSCKLVNPHLGR